MIRIQEKVRSLTETTGKIPKIVDGWYKFTRRKPLEAKLTQQLKTWEDEIVSNQEQVAINGLITRSGVTGEDNTAIAEGKIKGYYDVTNNNIAWRRRGAFWSSRLESLSSFSPAATLLFKETINRAIDHSFGTSPVVDIVSGGLIALAGLVSFTLLQLEAAQNRQKGRLLQAHEGIFKAQKQLAIDQVKTDGRAKAIPVIGYFQKNLAELAIATNAAKEDLKRLTPATRRRPQIA